MSTSRSERHPLKRARVTAAFVLAGCLLVGCNGEERSPGSDDVADRVGKRAGARNNVVVIVIDTLRPDHLGFHGYHRETAPYLASLAEKAVVFTHAVSTSTWTAPSTTSLFTGLHPLRHGVQLGIVAHRRMLESHNRAGAERGVDVGVGVDNSKDKEKDENKVKVQLNRIPASVSTLPELFRESGYRTFGIAANPNIGASIGFDRGFDRLLSAPGLGVRPGTVESRVSIMGVLPTLLELVGAPVPADCEGVSFAPLLLRGDGDGIGARTELEQKLKERVLVVHRVAQFSDDPAVSWAVMQGRWKLIHDRSRVEL